MSARLTFCRPITRDKEGLDERDHEEEEDEKSVEGEIPVDFARPETSRRQNLTT